MPENEGNNCEKEKKQLPLYVTALIIEGASVAAFLLAAVSVFLPGVFLILFLLLVLAGLMLPVVGIILGIISLCTKNQTRRGIALSVVAILLPIAAFSIIIVLFSQNVLVISLM